MPSAQGNRDKIYASERLKTIREELKELLKAREDFRNSENVPQSNQMRRQRIYVIERIRVLKDEADALRPLVQA